VKPSTIPFISAAGRVETGHTINVPDLASEITESLADLDRCSAPSEGSAPIAHVVAELGRFVKEKPRLVWAHSA